MCFPTLASRCGCGGAGNDRSKYLHTVRASQVLSLHPPLPPPKSWLGSVAAFRGLPPSLGSPLQPSPFPCRGSDWIGPSWSASSGHSPGLGDQIRPEVFELEFQHLHPPAPPHVPCALSLSLPRVQQRGRGPPNLRRVSGAPAWPCGQEAVWPSRGRVLPGLQQPCARRCPRSGLLPSGHLLPEGACWAPVQRGRRWGSDCARPLEASAAQGGPGEPARTGSEAWGQGRGRAAPD